MESYDKQEDRRGVKIFSTREHPIYVTGRNQTVTSTSSIYDLMALVTIIFKVKEQYSTGHAPCAEIFALFMQHEDYKLTRHNKQALMVSQKELLMGPPKASNCSRDLGA